MTIAGTLLPPAIRKRPFFDSQSPIEYHFAARRYASAVHSRVCLSVCQSVCLFITSRSIMETAKRVVFIRCPIRV